MQVKGTTTPIKRFSSQKEYLGSRASAQKSLGSEAKKLANGADSKAKSVEKTSDVSKTQDISQPSSGSSSSTSLVKEAGKTVAAEAIKAGLSHMRPAVAMAKNIAKKNKLKAAVQNDDPKRFPPRKKPLALFFKGFEMFGSTSKGLEKLAEHLPHSRVYSWTDEEEAVEEIKRHHSGAPLILAGDGLGSDTAVNIAQKLNTLENGFRKVNLLVTMDSIGSDNDVIPTNTEKNLNFIGERQGFFNDGPNIAKAIDDTQVINELRSEETSDIDEDEAVMKKIFEAALPLIENYDPKAVS